MGLKDTFRGKFGIIQKPMKTIQKQINMRPPVASKFAKIGKIFKQASTGRRPMDTVPRYKQVPSAKTTLE